MTLEQTIVNMTNQNRIILLLIIVIIVVTLFNLIYQNKKDILNSRIQKITVTLFPLYILFSGFMANNCINVNYGATWSWLFTTLTISIAFLTYMPICGSFMK